MFPAMLFRAERPARFVAVAWTLCFAGSLLLSALVNLAAPSLAGPDFGRAPGPLLFFLIVVFSPLLETLIMAGALSLLLRFVSPGVAVLLSALGWGIAHSAEAPAWGLVIWWPFLVLSISFVTWRERGFWPAVGIAALIHSLQNVVPALMVAIPHR